jgi:hypothetical protein
MPMSAEAVHAGPPEVGSYAEQLVARERAKSLLLRAWIASGLFFMALPGTLLGFSNLMAISAHHGAAGLPPAWMEGHGHAQMFGWIGSFILGIGFYSQPARGRDALRLQRVCFVLWTLGVAMRWVANIYGWHWEILLPLSASLEFAAVVMFLFAASHHKPADPAAAAKRPYRMPQWMMSVLLGTFGLAAVVTFNLVECLRLALYGDSPAFPHGLDQRYLALAGWGFIVPVVWGFSARWLPTFLGRKAPRTHAFGVAIAADVAGVLAAAAFGSFRTAAVLLACGAVLSGFALVWTPKSGSGAKTIGVHRSFPLFARVPYVWLAIAGALSVWAAFADQHGGIWGASRHALTVGFAATMVFAIGPRILPHFSGIQRIFSTRLMFVCLLLLQIGCTLRVASEPLAYEGIASSTWNILPVSGVLELTAVLLFALNLAMTFAAGKSTFAAAHLA